MSPVITVIFVSVRVSSGLWKQTIGHSAPNSAWRRVCAGSPAPVSAPVVTLATLPAGDRASRPDGPSDWTVRRRGRATRTGQCSIGLRQRLPTAPRYPSWQGRLTRTRHPLEIGSAGDRLVGHI